MLERRNCIDTGKTYSNSVEELPGGLDFELKSHFEFFYEPEERGGESELNMWLHDSHLLLKRWRRSKKKKEESTRRCTQKLHIIIFLPHFVYIRKRPKESGEHVGEIVLLLPACSCVFLHVLVLADGRRA